MPLTSLEIQRSSPRPNDYWMSDEKGLRLLVKPNGARYWRLKYRFQGKQKTLALGVYPEVGLKEARLARDKARIQIAEGVDPGEARKAEKQKNALANGMLFFSLAKAWWDHQRGIWIESYAQRVWNRLELNCLSELDKRPADAVRPQDIIAIIRRVEEREALDVAKRTLQDIRRIYRYAVQNGLVETNPASELTGIVKVRQMQHQASLSNKELGQFLCELEGYGNLHGRQLTRLAMLLLVFTFSRPGEVHQARWEEFDFEEGLWRIPAERMKMKTPHLVPMSHQVFGFLDELRPITGHNSLLFPSERDRDEPISNNTLRRAMHRLGYDGKTAGKSKGTPHGFRANASSILNEKGFNADAIERQLSHLERNNVRAAYIHHAQFLEERREMMQWWADYLDKEKVSARQRLDDLASKH